MGRNYVYGAEFFTAPGLHDVHIDAAMSNISIAYRNSNYIATQIFPLVPVKKQSDKFFKFEKRAWFRDEAQARAMGTRAARVDYELTTDLYACMEYGAAKGIPDEIVKNADNPLNPDREGTEFVTDKLLLRMEKDVADIVFGSSIWSSSANATTVWDNDTSDPINDVVGDGKILETVRGKIGRNPNIVVLGAQVWATLRRHPDLLDRVKYTQIGKVSPALVADLFEVEKILIGTGIIDSAKEGATESIADIWGNFAWFGYVAPTPGLMVPSAGYTFVWQDRKVERFREDQEKQDVVTATWSWDAKTTSADSGYLLKSVTTA